MKPRRPLGPGMRLLLRGIHAVNRRTLGYSAPFLDEVVRQYGLRGALTRLTRVQEIAELLEARLGERDAHLLIGFASLWNGCSFCTLGHIHAANLAHFRDTGALLPLAEDELRRRMLADDDAALLAHLRDVLADQHAATLARLERQYQLKTGEVPHPALLPGTPAAAAPRGRPPRPRHHCLRLAQSLLAGRPRDRRAGRPVPAAARPRPAAPLRRRPPGPAARLSAPPGTCPEGQPQPATSRASRPKVRTACASRSDHGNPQLMRMQFAKRGLAEKIGPGATLICCASARACSSSALVPGGNSTHSTKPPAGRDTRVPAGKCSAIAWLTCRTCAASLRRIARRWCS